LEFVRLGIVRDEKILYLVNLTTAANLKALLSDAGINADALIEKGQRVILAAKEAYLQDGTFDPLKMTDLLRQQTDRALRDGLCATSERRDDVGAPSLFDAWAAGRERHQANRTYRYGQA
jgi:hypothetical protein